MKTVCADRKCAGCGACVDACSKNAIKIDDNIMYLNAVIDEGTCVSCGKCYKTCPINSAPGKTVPIIWNQSWVCDEKSRLKSSSGGLGYELASSFVIREGGVVVTCSFIKGKFKFVVIDNVIELESIRGSKYVKSDASGIYKTVAELLFQGRKVLFIGLPCQVAAVKNYTERQRGKELLYTVDLICHGTPSIKILEKMLAEEGIDLQNVDSISFREKNQFGCKVDGNYIGGEGIRDRYTIGFLKGLFYTESCYSCEYAELKRCSDLTIGDSWGSELNEHEKKCGISLALCQNERGEALLNNCNLHIEEVDLQKAVNANKQLQYPSIELPERNKFFERIRSGDSYKKAVTSCFRLDCYKQDVKRILNMMKR